MVRMLEMNRQWKFASSLFGCMLAEAMVWVIVGTPAAALVAACRVFVCVIFSLAKWRSPLRCSAPCRVFGCT
jgi:hypothetical protein